MRYTERESKAAVKSPIVKLLCYSLVIRLPEPNTCTVVLSCYWHVSCSTTAWAYREGELFKGTILRTSALNFLKVLSHLSTSQYSKFSKLQMTQGLKIQLIENVLWTLTFRKHSADFFADFLPDIGSRLKLWFVQRTCMPTYLTVLRHIIV